MAGLNFIPERSAPNGVALNFDAPFSGELEKNIIEKALAKLPEAIREATAAWESIHEGRSTGLAPMFDEGPFDNAVREGTWRPELQVKMPTAGGLPGSKGMKQIWQYSKVTDRGAIGGNEGTKAEGERIPINIFEKKPKGAISVMEDARRATEEQRQETKDDEAQTQRFIMHDAVQNFDLTLEDVCQNGDGEGQSGNGESSSSTSLKVFQTNPNLQSPKMSAKIKGERQDGSQESQDGN